MFNPNEFPRPTDFPGLNDFPMHCGFIEIGRFHLFPEVLPTDLAIQQEAVRHQHLLARDRQIALFKGLSERSVRLNRENERPNWLIWEQEMITALFAGETRSQRRMARRRPVLRRGCRPLLPSWQENLTHWFWSMLRRPELWILLGASLVFFFGMCQIGGGSQ